jgi:drug/metabolite transporter (DMT)-like permease
VHWKSAVVIGALMLLGGNGLVTWSELRVSSGVAALIVACVPLWMVILDGKRPSARMIGGLALGLAGIAILVGPKKLAGGDRVDLIGAGALVLASLSWAIGSLYSKKAPLPESKLLATAMEMFGGGALLLVLGVLTGETSGFSLSAVSARSVIALLYLIFAGSLIGFTCYVWLLRVVSPARAATYAYVNPMVALLLGWLIAGEAMSGRTLVAATVIVGAVAMILSRSSSEKAKISNPDSRSTSALAGNAEPEGA